ncbi:MAG: LL-diaminopimelate aminotransferase [Oscillospiraceae bacterium]|jgi:LL-diaminopimelate aminotransferase|nr:LL-diaminopimelate aminotransferase [Oscillospiraceae bacterium]
MINKSAAALPKSYLFSEVGRRVGEYQKENPSANIIRMGIGDVTLPLPKACVDAMKAAADEQLCAATFRGYGPDQGYAFLREAIADNDYKAFGADVSADEIFISDGAKSDCANIQEMFDNDCIVGVSDPVYPVYIDSNGWNGRLGKFADGKWETLVTFPCTPENGFIAAPPVGKRVDLIYLCFPNNPTGAAATRAQLAAWVDYAKTRGAVILFDAAYRAFIRGDEIPRSIYEIEGARDCAIEFGSFSKSAGFTGTRCSWTVVPHSLTVEGEPLHALWTRRQATKFNGVPYVIQRAAEAVYSKEGAEQAAANIEYYRKNAAAIMDALRGMGYPVWGAEHSPYAWVKCPQGLTSWEFFDILLKRANVVCTPGSGFGSCGEGYVRLSAFNTYENTLEAMGRIAALR